MFSPDKKSRLTSETTREQNKIATGTVLKGDIEGLGCLRVDGTIEGNVSTPGKVVVGKEGVIVGDLECENADIEGVFSGNLKISGILTLRSTARIEGQATVGKLAVEPGAAFNASCTMDPGVKAIKNERQGQRQEKSA